MYEKKKPQTVVKYETLIHAIFLSDFCCCCCFGCLYVHRLTESTCKLFHIKLGVIVTFNVYRFIHIVCDNGSAHPIPPFSRLPFDMWEKWNRTHRRHPHRSSSSCMENISQNISRKFSIIFISVSAFCPPPPFSRHPSSCFPP